jgi:hypothetical protein
MTQFSNLFYFQKKLGKVPVQTYKPVLRMRIRINSGRLDQDPDPAEQDQHKLSIFFFVQV